MRLDLLSTKQFAVVGLSVESGPTPSSVAICTVSFSCSCATPVDLLCHTTTIHKEVSQQG